MATTKKNRAWLTKSELRAALGKIHKIMPSGQAIDTWMVMDDPMPHTHKKGRVYPVFYLNRVEAWLKRMGITPGKAWSTRLKLKKGSHANHPEPDAED